VYLGELMRTGNLRQPLHQSALIYHGTETAVIPYDHTTGEQCLVCGGTTGPWYARQDIVKPTFNNLDVLANPAGTTVCAACAWCMSNKEHKNRNILRMHHFLATQESLEWIDKPGFPTILFDPPKPPFVLAYTFTHKKHHWLFSPVNYTRDVIRVGTDERTIQVTPERDAPYFNLMQEFYYYFNKTEIESRQFPMSKIWKAEIDEALFYQQTEQLEQRAGESIFPLFLDMLQKPDEEPEWKKRTLTTSQPAQMSFC